ncbi:Polyketide cyclase / dehydrase and lipid transport [Chitinophaga sp. CF118]|uniref:SRPBCC family protein n=1 Tax=Chitinophaga sp. CF118 TaxID=1884367 RepID=UPI0008E1B4BB|nr:SRPBCC family protein [Chitinophaga sp. CF118]SFE96477.1 Polyketide cyclase / dehydrase and lipid transport [Chitinophaga sp. CF118]
MSIIITILGIIIALIVLLLIVALFIKKKYTIEREIVINKPKQEVFNYIRMLKNQDYFSKWVMTDPNMKKEFKGTDGTVGFVYAWEGNKQAGKGEQEITKIMEGERLDVEVRFKKPFEAIAQTPFTTSAVTENQTKLTWGMSSEMKYPMNIMCLFTDNMLGKDLELSLANLKNILER